jgi:hypothetical protein
MPASTITPMMGLLVKISGIRLIDEKTETTHRAE